jgi:chorismate mutase/prephenate dehydratase
MSTEKGPPPSPAAPPAGGASPALKALRQQLDTTDEEIVRLVSKRLDTVKQIIAEKAGRTAGIRDPQREREVLSRVEAIAEALGMSGPLARKIFSEIIAHSVTRQASTLSGLAPADRELRVAYHGTAYTYNHLAALKFLSGQGAQGLFVGRPSIKEAVAAVEADAADLAFIPIENTTGGSINVVYDILRTRDLHIVGEETYEVNHCLAGVADTPLGAVERVLSHPLALEQCSLFLAELPRARPVPTVDSAEALRLVAEAKDPTQVAIGSPEGIEAFGLGVLRRNIGNHEELLTRYVALSRTPARFDARIPCKTSLILSTRHEHGALLRCLQVLSDYGLQLTKLESRPRTDRPWEYNFFLDFEGNTADETVAAALDELRLHTLFLKVLGCYPAKATPSEAQAAAVKAAALAPGLPAAPDRAALPAPASTAPAPRPAGRPARLVDRHGRPDTVVRIGDLLIGGAGFTVIAGPAAIESEAQLAAVARTVKERGAHVLRGGLFVPRTAPEAFHGLGLPGLDLLVAAGRSVGLPVLTEVHAPEHVRPVAHKADVLLIGARNMQNFALLKEVGKVDRPVVLKRGPSSTIDEWLVAAESILAQGNGQVILCERGIRTFESATRNTLDLSAVVVLKERTHLPIVVDPCHGTGRRDYVAPMAWAARACGAHGLLLEVHPEPAQALTEAEQSLSFTELATLMDGLGRWRG